MSQAFTTLITTHDLHNLMKAGSIAILDCTYFLNDVDKGRKEYLQAHIPGAYFMDIGLDLSATVIPGVTGRHPLPDPEVLAFSLRACGINQDSQVIVYDQGNGFYAARGWWLLKWLGHNAVALLDGGFAAWKQTGFPVDNQWPPPGKGHFQPHVRSDLTVVKEKVLTHGNTVIDSRDYKRYTGENEPIDPIAGHIPGAICIPFADNVDEKGYWKSKSFFQEKFKTWLYDTNNIPVFYCGSGVTACHNILAYQIATGKEARLYAGSWSEWLNYYPIETGIHH